MLLTGSLYICVCFSVSSGFLRTGLPGEVFVSKRRELWPRQRSLFLSCWLDRSVLQPEWVTDAWQKVIELTGAGVTPVLWKRGGIRGSDGLYQNICVAASKHREHLFNADSHWNKNTLGFRVIWENPALPHMRKHRLDVPHALAYITFQTLEFPLLISRVHEEVMILFVPLLAACPPSSYGEGCNQTCSCRNDGICHPASGQCVCTPGWTGPNCTEGEWAQHRAKSIVYMTGKQGVTRWFCVCFFFIPECPAGFYGANCQQRCLCQNGATCNKTNGKCTCASGWMGTACELGKTLRCCE